MLTLMKMILFVCGFVYIVHIYVLFSRLVLLQYFRVIPWLVLFRVVYILVLTITKSNGQRSGTILVYHSILFIYVLLQSYYNWVFHEDLLILLEPMIEIIEIITIWIPITAINTNKWYNEYNYERNNGIDRTIWTIESSICWWPIL